MFGAKQFVLPVWSRSLSARLLVLTVVFVMVAEVLIYAPSVANFRLNWLRDRIAAAQLAVVALESTPVEALNEARKQALLDRAGVMSIGLNRADRRLMLYVTPPGAVDLTIDIAGKPGLTSIGAAFATMARGGSVLVRVVGPSPDGDAAQVEVILDEAVLREKMYGYSRNILLLSIVISLITATCLYVALQTLLVRPVSKINHDLRGILSTAVLVSDRLAGLDDPRVKAMAPPLVQAIDRAINLCTQTLNFARDEGPQLHRSRFRLADLVDEVAAELSILGDAAANLPAPCLDNRVPADIIVEADRDQLYRVFANLARNAFEARARTVTVTHDRAGADATLVIDVADDGPGLASTARKGLFTPFSGSARQGGTGLGLVIARDVMRAHGGDIQLLRTGDAGTVFRLALPRRK